MTHAQPHAAVAPGPLAATPDEACRIVAPREIAALLRRLCEAGVPLNLRHGDGACEVRAELRAFDTAGHRLSLDVATHDAALPALLEAQYAIATCRLEQVEIRFEIDDPVLVHAEHASVLSCSGPRDVFRFQRRSAFRVRPPMRGSPAAQLWLDGQGAAPLELRVLDVSISGCALFQPTETAPMPPGHVFRRVHIELDAQTRLVTDLRLHHVSSLGAQATGVRLGCEFVDADANMLRTLQRFIDAAQKRDAAPALA